MSGWKAYIEKAKAYHGHICSGQVLGIRMGLLGIAALGLKPDDDMRDLVVFAESSRCMADAVYVVTGITVGRRRLKLVDYGKTALSFLDLKTNRAVRVSIKSPIYPPKGTWGEGLIRFWDSYADDDVFNCVPVTITLPLEEMPGPPISIVPCSCCGEDVLDAKEIYRAGQPFCHACARGAYYRVHDGNGEKRADGQGGTNPWAVYDALLDDIPADLRLKKLIIGRRWIMALSDSGGIGLAMNIACQDMSSVLPRLEGQSLAQVAARIKSWNFFEASVGMAVLNAAVNTAALTEGSTLHKAVATASGKAFEYHTERIRGKKVAVIGHFPHLETLAPLCELSILERKPRDGDLPDSAADYILPLQDSIFMTGTTLTNKTFPHLMDITRSAFTCIVGPSTPMSPVLFKYGINALSGTVVTDASGVEMAVRGESTEDIFTRGGNMINLLAP